MSQDKDEKAIVKKVEKPTSKDAKKLIAEKQKLVDNQTIVRK